MSLVSMSLPEPKIFIGALSQVHEILVHNQWSGAQLRDLKRLFTNDFFRGFGKQTRICRQHRQNVATLAKGLTRSDSRRSNVAAALMAALGVTALDVLAANKITGQRPRRSVTRRYLDRSGFPKGRDTQRTLSRSQRPIGQRELH